MSVFLHILVDYILLNWNSIIAELRSWQELGVAIEQAQVA
ncbi:MAG: hypothetical protein QG664_718 [Patescibacteria group bacterium]|nr:hypothetical protein [Patescibacteria group bacterium]